MIKDEKFERIKVSKKEYSVLKKTRKENNFSKTFETHSDAQVDSFGLEI